MKVKSSEKIRNLKNLMKKDLVKDENVPKKKVKKAMEEYVD
ncbi:MAG: hypothetical protein R3327_07470 [Nitrosopumilaceae archaeon]|nr:hypothetical protein [Nitrosopumilaceae archaeon]